MNCAKYREILRGTLDIQICRLVFKFHMHFPLPTYLTSALLHSEKTSERYTLIADKPFAKIV